MKLQDSSASKSGSSYSESEEEKKEYNPIRRYKDEKPLVIKRE